MTIHPKSLLTYPLLALALALVAATTLPAPASAAATASLQINFGNTPHWSGISGTRVREIRRSDRHPDYDMFRYGNRYYAYNNNQWYSSRRSQGSFAPMEERSVPRELSRVPRLPVRLEQRQ
jgi:hypothetical protein